MLSDNIKLFINVIMIIIFFLTWVKNVLLFNCDNLIGIVK